MRGRKQAAKTQRTRLRRARQERRNRKLAGQVTSELLGPKCNCLIIHDQIHVQRDCPIHYGRFEALLRAYEGKQGRS